MLGRKDLFTLGLLKTHKLPILCSPSSSYCLICHKENSGTTVSSLYEMTYPHLLWRTSTILIPNSGSMRLDYDIWLSFSSSHFIY